MADYERDVGSGDQLDSGEATDLNESAQQGRAVADAVAPEPMPVKYAEGPEPDYQPKDDIEELLFGPAEGVRSPMLDPTQPVPNSIVRALPQLSAIVADPTTPAVIRAAYNLIIQRIEAEHEALY